jgi:light-regulated signal transduction histidine kinase (bacteriophytochrome)
MNKSGNEKKKEARNVAKALADVPIDNKRERDALRARLRKKYAELKALKVGMSKQVRERFEELGELMDLLEECETCPPQTRS